MRQFASFLLVLLIAAAVYTALGEFGYHDYWQPIEFRSEKEGESTSKTVQVKLNLDDIEEQASKFIERGNVKETIQSLNQKLQDLQGNQRKKHEPKIQFWLGRGYAQVGQSEKARAKFQRYLELRPDSDRKAEVLYYLGKTYQSDRKKRESFFRRAAELDPLGEVAKKVAKVYESALGPDPTPVKELLNLSLKLRHLTESGSEERKQMYQKLQEPADKVFKSGEKFLDAKEYVVQQGDALSRVARKFNVGMGWLNYTNHRSLPVTGPNADAIATRLRPQDRLVIYPGRLYLETYIRDTRLSIFYKDLYFVKSYRVGVGKGGAEKTPTGEYIVTNKSAKPRWTHPETGEVLEYDDPDNILGTRWIGINLSGYGIHGIDPELEDTIGTKSSMGCIRMKNRNCEELFDIIPNGVQSMDDELIPVVRILK